MVLLAILIAIPGAARTEEAAKAIVMITWRGLTPAEYSFAEKLDELGINAKIEYFDAERDQTKLAGFLRERREDLQSKDLIYTFGTTATLTVQNFELETVPRVFNIVTDPVGVGLVPSLDAPPPGLTGAKMSLSPEVILDLLGNIHDLNTLAILFDPRESNAVAEADRLMLAAEKRGIVPKLLRFAPDADEKDLQIASFQPELASSDAVYVTSSSSYVAHHSVLREIIPEDLVSVSSSTAYSEEDVTLVFGTEYRERGEAAATLAAKILLEKVPAHSLPINEIAASDATLFVNRNSKAAAALQLENATNPVVYR
ncbi:ABC transporter substrate binding protein [Roseibium sp. HPY-6]|uniref:ABC transporter substrate binding protein n=1 Tax=Roseibium sp. HPY-6 TaxID=3229852 RepID=UPI00338E9743